MEGFMLSRRDLVRLSASLAAGGALGLGASRPASASTAALVSFPYGYESGAVVVSTRQRLLYFVQGDGSAIRYRVAVGRPGKQWFGTRVIDGKHVRPAWSPPAEVRRDKPGLPDVIPGGAPNNPMGAAALTIAPGEYAIHGTSASMRASIGSYASYGCIRMLDEDILDLLPRVRVGARIHVVP
jgi:lipoprotein-anchoring transpeptidase ErfK/SrfK